MKKSMMALFLLGAFGISLLAASPLDEFLPGLGLGDDNQNTSAIETPVGNSSLIVSLPSAAAPLSVDALLLSDPFSVSGRFSGTISIDEQGTIIPEVQARLGVDIRAGGSFRFHAASEIDLPSRFDTKSSLDLLLTELFADFSFGTSSFLRIGKQRGNWGTGRFWERGNLLDLDGRNRGTAPLAVRFSLSFSSVHHVDAWLLSPSTLVEAEAKEWGGAVSYDLSLSNLALQVGGVYRNQGVSGGMGSLATAIGPVQTALFGCVTYGFPGKPPALYPAVYYSVSLDFSWRTKGRRLFQLSGQVLAESFPNPSTGENVEHGQFALVQMRLFSPWENISGSITGQVRTRLDKPVGSWRGSVDWNPVDSVSLSLQIRGGWGTPLEADPWKVCSVPPRIVQCLVVLSVDKQF